MRLAFCPPKASAGIGENGGYLKRTQKLSFAFIEILPGQGFSKTTAMLVDAGVILSPARFKLIAAISGDDKKIKAGEQLVVETKVQGAGGTELGDWLPVIVWSPAPETNANALGLIASA